MKEHGSRNSVQLSLKEAAALIAFGDPELTYADGAADNPKFILAARKLFRWCEAGLISATGKWGDSPGLDSNDAWCAEEMHWTGHALDRSPISPDHFESWGFDIETSTLRTRRGEYVEVRVPESEVREMAAPDLYLGEPSHRGVTAIYTTQLLAVLDVMRAELASETNAKVLKRAYIEERCREISPEISKRDAEALATVLMPDEVRKKDGVSPQSNARSMG